MNIISDKKEMIFKRKYNGKNYYSIGISHKNQDGSYSNGYISCRFPKNNQLENDKTLINIKNAWLDFYLKDKATIPYIFINDYEIIDIEQEKKENIKVIYAKDMISDEDLPFDFNEG